MITYTDWPSDSRIGSPRVIACELLANRDFLTWSEGREEPKKILYAVIGGEYGFVHTSAGDVKFWKSASGARQWIKRNYSDLNITFLDGQYRRISS